MENKPKKQGYQGWAIGAVIATLWATYTATQDGDYNIGRLLGLYLIPILLCVSAFRAYRGKNTYFLRMLAVTLTVLFALFVFSGL